MEKKKYPNGFSFMQGMIIQSSLLPGAAASAFLQVATTSNRKTFSRHSLVTLENFWVDSILELEAKQINQSWFLKIQLSV